MSSSEQRLTFDHAALRAALEGDPVQNRTQLAEVLGISRAHLYALINGETTPGVELTMVLQRRYPTCQFWQYVSTQHDKTGGQPC